MYFLLLILILYLPFIDKAYHIDDSEFINMSGMIGWNPLHATPIDYQYNGMLLKGALPPYEMTHPLLVPYLIKIFSALFGQSEVSLHLSFMIFVVMTLASLLLINRALFPEDNGSGKVAALFLLAAPAFLVNSQDLMTDVPTLALLLCSVACYCHFVETGRPLSAYIGGGFLTLAAFTSYQSLLFSVILFIYLAAKRRVDIRSAVTLVLPWVMLFVWFLLVYQTHGIFPFFNRGGESSSVNVVSVGLSFQRLLVKFITFLSFTGSSLLFLVPAYLFFARSIIRFLVIIVPSLVILFFTIPFVADYPLFPRLFLALLASLGFFALTEAFFKCAEEYRNSRFKGRSLFLMTWIIICVVYTVAVYPWMAARYVLPILPPVIMILARGFTFSGTVKKKIVVAVAALLSVFFGFASAYSDYKYADSYRELAQALKQPASEGKVWFIGKWGMQYYLQKVGAHYLLADDNSPVRGDIVVIPDMPNFWTPSPSLQYRLVPFAQKKMISPLPLRLFNARSRAGFYTTNFGLLPFAISREPDEVFLFLRVFR